jgi:hypothetical protein
MQNVSVQLFAGIDPNQPKRSGLWARLDGDAWHALL